MRRSALLIALVSLACYAHLFLSPATEFVFDDSRFIEENEAVHDLSNTGRFFTDPTTVDPNAWTGIYRPLRTLDFAVDWAIAGASPRWFHFRNALYHAIGAVLLLLLLGRWGAGRVAATLGALVFALHPVQVEAAGWITSRGDLMCLVFFLLALWLHDRSRGYDGWFAGAAGLLVLALLSKEAAVMFPAAVFLVDFFFRDERRFRRSLKRWPKYLTYVILAGAYFALWTWLHVSRDAPRWHLAVRWGGGFFGTLLTMSRGFVYYFRLLLFPVDMATDWYLLPVKSPDPLTLACAAIVLFVLGWGIWRMFRKGGALAFAILWFFVTMFPTSNLPAPIGITTAERFLNLPLAGIALPAGLLLAWFWRRMPAGRTLAVATVACLGVVSIDRTFDWDSARTLWTATLRRYDSPRGLEWRADHLRSEAGELKRQAEALRKEEKEGAANRLEDRADVLVRRSLADVDRLIELWRRMPASEPAISVARSYRAFALYVKGDYEKALEEVEASLRLPVVQGMGRAYLVRALCFHDMGDLRASARAVERALDFWNNPNTRLRAAAIYQDLAQWYKERENYARTYAALKQSWKLLPDPVENAGVRESLLEYEERYERLVPQLRAATEADPGDPAAWVELATAFATYGRYEEAEHVFRQLLDRPGGRIPWILLAYGHWFWEERDTLEGYANATRIYEEVLQKDPANAAARDGLDRVAKKRRSLLDSLAR